VTEGFRLIIASGQAVGPTEPFVESLPVTLCGGGGGGGQAVKAAGSCPLQSPWCGHRRHFMPALEGRGS